MGKGKDTFSKGKKSQYFHNQCEINIYKRKCGRRFQKAGTGKRKQSLVPERPHQLRGNDEANYGVWKGQNRLNQFVSVQSILKVQVIQVFCIQFH